MRVMFGLVLIVGLALAGSAAYLFNQNQAEWQRRVQAAETKSAPDVETVPVYVAKRALAYGEPLTPEDVRQVSWPRSAKPEGVYTKEDSLFPNGNAAPRYIQRAMEKGEAILAVKVTEPGIEAGLTSRIDRGMRAFAISVDVATGVSGFLRPGDRVDVYWTGRVDGILGDFTKLIETGVELIAIDQSANTDVTGTTIARTVTVAVNPQQVATLAQAQSSGRLSLSLVGHGDDTVAEAIEVDQRSLLGIPVAEPNPEPVQRAPEPQNRVCTIRNRRGSEVVEIPIPCTD
ncbi:pilus assembly protein CpaB [Pseudooceanicola antarcticus]|uniref:Pilus assembly protein CpaB n=1 Tax=Pseudooceanicola antarcticus TaxID=1247613 RepID=A0A285ISN3_9RHOB|nr:Flp pilus assembly protein CpaB [Pseudooceanicola antarcticus]PJE31962.1 Flp pilus assembly protein CpaB [Pseudooceanicola antarcticus]SNY51029.1 pilus assembly protein CpaB [Pseudooceanicola antarcticus]